MAPTYLVGVYGTLRNGEGNAGFLRNARQKDTVTLTRYKMVSLGAFPAIYYTGDENDTVVMERYYVNDDILANLDRLEGYNGPGQRNLYDRDTQLIDGEPTLFYVMPYAEHRNPPAPAVAGGDWVRAA